MNARFNLLDETWLPVRKLDGRVEMVGLLELFARAGEMSGLAETDPPNLIAQYRLLLAIFHRALAHGKGQWSSRDMAGYYREGLPVDLIHAYLEQWRERFFLFHPEFPFMQVAALATAEETRDKTKPWTQIALSSSTGNAPVVFDHAVDTVAVAIAAPILLRQLLGFLQFTPGGLVKTLRDSDKAGALANTAAVMPQGDTLAQTLCLALHPASAQTEQDNPAWEKAPIPISALKGEPTLATGPNDRYTRLSRAVLLLPEDDGLAVTHIRFAAGVALADDGHAPDPMASYRMGSNGLVRLSFTEGRALWRDLTTFLPDASGKHAVPAAVLNWAETLRQSMRKTVAMPILVAGLASDQAKLLRWRAERFLLPGRLLEQAEASDELRGFLRPTEEDFSHLRQTATTMLARSMPDESHKDTRSRARTLFENGPAGALYFSALERQLPRLLDLIGESRLDEADAHWAASRRAALEQAWTAACQQSGTTAKALRAQERAEPAYRSLLKPLKSPSSVEEQAHV
ncbi:type I-E CRISPR-associated protein Cse1/CasA [Chromobacterium violaceum]|uniref:type I-E CRISPR-associated protein Cse1/CasA n=1 Tax=Chromobacterium violaceum TaxID=536 RepID=UPI0035A668B6